MELRTLTGHQGCVYDVAYSPDGTLLASAGYREVKFWRHPRDVQKLTLADAGTLREGVYTASAGNMAQGVAWCARTLGVPCRVKAA